jgi:hypothetical protein
MAFMYVAKEVHRNTPLLYSVKKFRAPYPSSMITQVAVTQRRAVSDQYVNGFWNCCPAFSTLLAPRQIERPIAKLRLIRSSIDVVSASLD